MATSRFGAMLKELELDLRIRLLRRRERKELIALGSAVTPPEIPSGSSSEPLVARLVETHARLEQLRREIAASRQADRADYSAVSPWMLPAIMLRGFSARAILRHQIASIQQNLRAIHESLGYQLVESGAGARVPKHRVTAVLETRDRLAALAQEHSRRLAPYGGSAVPRWVPRLAGEGLELWRAFWLQLQPEILPRLPALAGLAVGWWIADTYTTSHFKSVLNSLGIGSGGKRVVSGETYRTMLFWLPILAAGLCAYLANRAKVVIQRRYTSPVTERR